MIDPRSFREQLPTDKPYVVALSGGADSVALLILCRQLNLTFRAVHVNHGLQEAANRFSQFCSDLCTTLKVPLEVINGDCSAFTGGLEERARKLRHQVFEANLRAEETLLLGHHLNDQAETFLFRAARGAHLHGLSAMQQHTQLTPRVSICRPFLLVKKTDIVSFLHQNHIDWIHDPSNDENTVSRNIIRNKVIPCLEEAHPNAVLGLSYSLCAVQEGAHLAEVLAKEDYTRSADAGGNLCVARMTNLFGDRVRLRNLISYVLRCLGLSFDSVTVEQIVALMTSEGRAGAVNLKNKAHARMYRGILYLEQVMPDFSDKTQRKDWTLDSIPPLRWVPYSHSIRLFNQKKINDFLRQQAVVPWNRAKFPYLVDPNGVLVWFPGVPVMNYCDPMFSHLKVRASCNQVRYQADSV